MQRSPFDNHNSSSSSSGSDGMSYPIDLLRETANKIRANATAALQEHDRAWQAIQAYIDGSGPRPFNIWSPNQGQLDAELNVQPYLQNVLLPHAQRLRASYEWQMKLADALFTAIGTVQSTDTTVAQSFQPPRGFGREQ